jgi:isopentenyl-diphosphate delta-isomerase
MRPLLNDPDALGYRVRDVAPDALVIGNIGVVQAREAGPDRINELVEQTGVDAMVVHLNPSMEVVQFDGDVDFRGGLDTIGRLVSRLSVPVVVKETGCGLSHSVGKRLVEVGVQFADCSGAGGTSWVGVEALRERADTAGDTFWDWGIPTAGSLLQLAPLPLKVCATGGVKNGLDVARAIALGASCAGIARPVLQAWVSGGKEGTKKYLLRVMREVKIAMLLTGSRDILALQNSETILGDELSKWAP